MQDMPTAKSWLAGLIRHVCLRPRVYAWRQRRKTSELFDEFSKGNGQVECAVCFMWFRKYAKEKQMSSGVCKFRTRWVGSDGRIKEKMEGGNNKRPNLISISGLGWCGTEHIYLLCPISPPSVPQLSSTNSSLLNLSPLQLGVLELH